jgi:hypothetical protein
MVTHKRMSMLESLVTTVDRSDALLAAPASAAAAADGPAAIGVDVALAPEIAPPRRERLPLPAVEVWTLHVSTLLVGGTGLLYAWLRYVVVPSDPFAVVSRPWQPSCQHLHVLAAPLLVFGAGLVWRRHVWCGWRLGIRARRRSGLLTALSLLPMAASGYLLQVALEDAWRRAWGWVHLATGLLWLAGYLAHQLLPRPAPWGSPGRPDGPGRPSGPAGTFRAPGVSK